MNAFFAGMGTFFSWSWKHKVVSIAVLAVIFGGYYWWQSAHSISGQIQYVTKPATKGTITSSVSASGNVVVDSQANIDPSITGTVSNLAVSVGDTVKKGQLLFTIDNDQLSVSVAQATSSLESAQTAVAQAHANVTLAKRTHTSSTDLDILRQKATNAEQSLTATQLSNQKTLSDAAKRQVTSPIDGTVNAVNIKNGDDLANVTSGSGRVTPIIIGDLTTMKASVSVNEVDMSNVTIGQKAVLALSALGTQSFTGKVEKIDSLGTVSQGVVTYSVVIGVDSLGDNIRPGMSVSASLITAVAQNVVVVPSSAVKTNQDGSSYMEVMNGTIPEQKDVTVGLSDNTNTEIKSGVSAGDLVVTQTINPNAKATTASSSLPGLGGGGGGNNAFRGAGALRGN